MANHRGLDGIVKIGSDTVAELRSWSIDEQAAVLDDSKMGSTFATHQAGITSWTGQLTCWWDETDTTGQEVMVVGAVVTILFLPEGDTAGDIGYSGSASVTSISRSASHDGMVEATYQVTGSGVLTAAAVV